MMIFLGRCAVSYYVIFHKQGPGLWVDVVLVNLIYTTIPPSYPPQRGEENAKAWAVSCCPVFLIFEVGSFSENVSVLGNINRKIEAQEKESTVSNPIKTRVLANIKSCNGIGVKSTEDPLPARLFPVFISCNASSVKDGLLGAFFRFQ